MTPLVLIQVTRCPNYPQADNVNGMREGNANTSRETGPICVQSPTNEHAVPRLKTLDLGEFLAAKSGHHSHVMDVGFRGRFRQELTVTGSAVDVDPASKFLPITAEWICQHFSEVRLTGTSAGGPNSRCKSQRNKDRQAHNPPLVVAGLGSAAKSGLSYFSSGFPSWNGTRNLN